MCSKFTTYGHIPTAAFRNTTSPSGSSGYGHHGSYTSHIQGTPMGFRNNIPAYIFRFAIPMKEKSAEMLYKSTCKAYSLKKGGSITFLSDNATKFKNTILNEACDQHGTKRLFSNPFHPQCNSISENMQNFLKRTLTEFLESSDLE